MVKAFKLVDGINLKQNNKEYNSAKVLIDSDESDASDYLDQVSDCSDQEKLSTQLLVEIAITRAVLHQIKVEDPDALNKLCKPCAGSKLTWVVRWNKSMTTTSNKLEEVYTNFWRLHDPLS